MTAAIAALAPARPDSTRSMPFRAVAATRPLDSEARRVNQSLIASTRSLKRCGTMTSLSHFAAADDRRRNNYSAKKWRCNACALEGRASTLAKRGQGLDATTAVNRRRRADFDIIAPLDIAEARTDMEPQETDRTPGYVNQLSGAMDRLANAIGDATTASKKYAKSLARATWALV